MRAPSLLLILIALLAAPVAQASSSCKASSVLGIDMLRCQYRTQQVPTGGPGTRTVEYQLPDGTPPAGGWPAVVWYQTGVFPNYWNGNSAMLAGFQYESATFAKLLDAGYAVIAPTVNQARLLQYWDTNAYGVDTTQPYTDTEDYRVLTAVLDGLGAGQFGPINSHRLYATGMSSGGYNTSRMAVSFPGRFRALIVQSGSYATCNGSTCTLPAQLPSNHPPTLFLHGADDTIVPPATMQLYHDRLKAMGVEVGLFLAPGVRHAILAESPALVLDWVRRH